MRTIEVLPDGKWSVTEDGQCLFSGTRSEVEDWLDRQENLEAERRTSPQRERRGLLLSRLFGIRTARILPKH